MSAGTGDGRSREIVCRHQLCFKNESIVGEGDGSGTRGTSGDRAGEQGGRGWLGVAEKQSLSLEY